MELLARGSIPYYVRTIKYAHDGNVIWRSIIREQARPQALSFSWENILGIKWRPGEKNRFDTAHRAPLTNRSRTSWHSQNFNSYPSTPERTIHQHSGIVSTRRRRRAAIVCLYVYVAVTKSRFQLSFHSARYGSLPCDSLSRWISTCRAIPRNHQPGKQVKPSPSPFPLPPPSLRLSNPPSSHFPSALRSSARLSRGKQKDN